MWGDPHPWERAGVTYEAWYRMLRRVTQAHVKADSALHSLFPDSEHPVLSFSFDEFHKRKQLAEQRQRDFFDAINGDGARILDLMDEFGDEPPEASS
jgi:hypothetical protein